MKKFLLIVLLSSFTAVNSMEQGKKTTLNSSTTSSKTESNYLPLPHQGKRSSSNPSSPSPERTWKDSVNWNK